MVHDSGVCWSGLIDILNYSNHHLAIFTLEIALNVFIFGVYVTARRPTGSL